MMVAVTFKNAHQTAYYPPGGQARRAVEGGVSTAKNRRLLPCGLIA
jgi:hypothetical protein